MSEHLIFSEVQQELPPHPLLPDGFGFNDRDRPIITEWGDVLPPAWFSMDMFLLLEDIAQQPRIHDDEPLILLARYLEPKLKYEPTTGCWELPLKAEYDDKRRARYPQVSIAALGYKNLVAHRASVEIFLGQSIEGISVDHRCRSHACCNPYHLEAVTTAVNNRRMRHANKRRQQPELFQLDSTQTLTYAQIGALALFH